jgi:2-keto-4-pentenoate hydratase/2-oxohepta-3-ene-1,7-dioic acid hydratase in catechol pathway
MKIARYRNGTGSMLGRVVGKQIFPLAGINDVQALIADWPKAASLPVDQRAAVPLADAKLLAPIMPRRNIFCVGWNYLPHFNESIGKREGQEVDLPDRPTFFTKLPTTVAGPYDDLPLHQAHTARLDWEVELAVVIGKQGRDIHPDHALEYVFGYTVANDISARDLQRAHGGQWFKGKSLDGTCPLGPIITTADELQDPQNLALSCRVNGQTMQDSHTRWQIFDVSRVITELSAGLTLLPGDIILTGTPDGIGNARNPPIYLRDGDTLESCVDGIGCMRNVMRANL